VTRVIAALGDRDPAYPTHREIDAAIALAPPDVEMRWVPTEDARIDGFDAVWVLPGTPYRDDHSVYAAIRFAREHGMPILGTCGGFQYMAVEFARNAARIAGAGHAETDPGAEVVVVGQLACSLVGEERRVSAVPGTRLASICGLAPFAGFHWCNYGLAEGSVDRLADSGLVISAHADDAGVEAFELPSHPFYLATLFQPQVGSSSRDSLHPVLEALVEATRDHASSRHDG
jgi:CTP synthase (UTP-ammonia lyase)